MGYDGNVNGLGVPPGQKETAPRAGTKRDGDIKRSDPEHNTYDHLNQPLLLLHLATSRLRIDAACAA